ncbi:6-chlorohydroxyquinol-1,2-dioxygenase [Streptomyces ipomoeae]|jgi:catechol 1,2-dioxygenase|uniref:Dioxygenase n=2 Tax=Streptomyces ipomoeae TaxID=103232 RepID=L1L591_9ACTN|nr:intradiol ring-cleavage dioxygenase [Streptomyces ipomoeae]EKX67855.1 dioxygenase [Streptomyces ipomoeae 91-03]MDX2696650.1 intradiol ring-cleavage dioxygenase [Streptomyces ipomoeae]MDX2842419.1 intradiol ring-cleavage dioxygenase [Streptomyces ipomoeae]TQE35314.1 6-chlorohydroxyquinol-1,2-dioxygenase [Streptomyces ipomoeae]
MTIEFTNDITDAVVDSFEGTTDPRLREVLGSLVRHLHDFVRETRPTMAEWERAIGFLTATGQTCTDTRQEFILLSDVLGVSMLVETINGEGDGHGDVTESTVLGPFHMTESPVRDLGADIDLVGSGEPCVISGRVRSADGTPLAGAVLDVWQANAEGFYDVQQPEIQPAGNGRGLFTTDDEGRFWFRTCVPSPYPIPTDGPVGDLLGATGRHPYRPAHIHFIASADGYAPVTTHIFVAGSDYLDSDAVFAVKKSLVQDFSETDDPSLAQEFGIPNPFRHARFDLVLNALDEGKT